MELPKLTVSPDKLFSLQYGSIRSYVSMTAAELTGQTRPVSSGRSIGYDNRSETVIPVPGYRLCSVICKTADTLGGYKFLQEDC